MEEKKLQDFQENSNGINFKTKSLGLEAKGKMISIYTFLSVRHTNRKLDENMSSFTQLLDTRSSRLITKFTIERFTRKTMD